jgi:hypothetical protein
MKTTFSHMMPRVTAILALALSAALSGCAGSDEFKLERRVVVDSQAPSGTAVSGLEAVDLSAVGDTWVNRDHLRDVAVHGVTVSVLTVDGDNTAARASGSLALRPDGAPADGSGDVSLGTFDEVRLVPGQTLTLPASAASAAGAALEKALAGSGKVALVVSGQADRRPVGFALKVALDVRARYAPLGRL